MNLSVVGFIRSLFHSNDRHFLPENSEPFTLYCICGGLVGLIIILIGIIVLLLVGKYRHVDSKSSESDYAETPAYLPIYRYNGRNQSSLYHV